MKKFTSREIKEFVSKPPFDEKVILNKDPSYPKIFIVIPVHNRKELTRLCLESLRGQDYQGFKVLVFDDGSTDGTATMIAGEYPEIVLLKGDGSYWWSRSVNEGIRYALNNRADYVLTFNNDVELAKDYISSFIPGIEKYPNALQGSLTYDIRTRKIVYDGLIRNWRKAKIERICDLYEKGNFPHFIRVTHLPGRGILIPSKVFTDIGFFDAKNFPQSAADYDFSLKAAKAGYSVIVNTRVILYSLGEMTGSTFRDPYSLKNLFGYLTSLKSNYNIRILFKFYCRHCPKKYFVYNLAKIYALGIGSYIKGWLQNKSGSSNYGR